MSRERIGGALDLDALAQLARYQDSAREHRPSDRATLRAVRLRLERYLTKHGQRLCRARSPDARHAYGSEFVVDLTSGTVARAHVDVVALARELGVLKNYEAVT